MSDVRPAMASAVGVTLGVGVGVTGLPLSHAESPTSDKVRTIQLSWRVARRCVL
jgi:hypothetical protein